MNGRKNSIKRTVVIAVENIGSYEVPTGSNLRETLRREGVYIDGTCSDNGTCGRCVVRILDGDAGAPSLQETALLGGRFLDPDHRLACRITVRNNLSISIDDERMLEVDRAGHWKEVWGSPLWQPDLIQLDREGFGVAVDLGTTSIAAGLFELSYGRPLDLRIALNPQAPWGEEILSRLDAAAGDSDVAAKLSLLVWDTIKDQIRSLCLRNGVSGGRIVRMVVVGNSAMHHLSLALPAAGLLTPPYTPSLKSPMQVDPEALPIRLPVSRDAVIYFPPLAGGYAGSDAVASLMAALSTDTQCGALLDVGTNTEIAVWKGKTVYMATAPSGPAFEGGHISCGMKAREGAVWKVDIISGKVVSEVIGPGPPTGICGTGMIDAMASMLRSGILDRSGLLLAGSHDMVADGGFVLDAKNGIALKGEDIATLQKAKSAIAATFMILLNALALTPAELDSVFLAGEFGSRLDIGSAITTGLLPALPVQRYILAGNTAMVGASMILLSDKEQKKGELLSRTIKHYEVSQDPEFEELFIDNLYFPQA